MAKRAYGSEDKKARRDDIVEAARRLFAAGTGDLPSVACIAEAAGLAKGTVYLYSRTKETIYADLLLDSWSNVLRDVEEAFGQGDDGASKVSAFLTRLTIYFDQHPELLRLDALGYGVIERNLEQETRHQFKRGLNDRLASAGAVIDHTLGLPRDRGLQLLMRTYALTRGLWLSFGDQADTTAADGGLLYTDFKSELGEALTEYWRGALAV